MPFSPLSRFALVFAFVFSFGFNICSPAAADTDEHKAAEIASGSGNLIYLGLGVGLPLLSDGSNGTRHSLRTMDAVGTSVLIAEGLKSLTHEQRPDKSDHDSFPSGHATAAFAVATVESDWHPREAPFWLLGAALISASRVRLHRHNLWDVAAGALLGYGISRLELSEPRGLLLAPFIQPYPNHSPHDPPMLQLNIRL